MILIALAVLLAVSAELALVEYHQRRRIASLRRLEAILNHPANLKETRP